MVIRDGRWFSKYPPGHSLVMALGVLAGVPWLVNPLLGALAVVLLYRLGVELFGETTGRVAGLLGLLSPFLLFMSSEYMNHPTAHTTFLAALIGYMRALKSKHLTSGLWGGACLGLVALTRPLTALALGLPLAARGAWAFVKGGRTVRLPLAGFGLTAAAVAALLFTYNAVTTGSPWQFGYEALHGPGHAPGFGHSGWGAAHTPLKGLINTLTNLNALEMNLLEWPVPSLALVALLFATGRSREGDYLLLAVAACLSAAYFFYWYHDLCFGPRFLFEAGGPLLLLVARGLCEFADILRCSPKLKVAPGVLAMGLGLSLAWMLTVSVPFLVQLYGNDYLGGTSRAVLAVRRAGVENAVVFVNSFYPSAFAENRPGLDGPVVYARDLPDRRRLARLYPGRNFYREVEGRLVLLPPEEVRSPR
jgi:4-amino-4-deoxy-L-arabinose transferase-like glycosyltransferase